MNIANVYKANKPKEFRSSIMLLEVMIFSKNQFLRLN